MDDDGLYNTVTDHEKRLTKLESEQPFLKDILERNTASSEKLAQAMNEVQISMVNLNNKMEDQAEAMESMNKEITKVNEKVDTIDEKSKFDIHLFLKREWPWIVTMIGIGMLLVSKFVKF